MQQPLSKPRSIATRFLYLLTGVTLGIPAGTTVTSLGAAPDPIEGIAYSFWAAFSALALLGVRFPVQMLPLLLLQFFYKSVWMIAVGYPLWAAGNPDPMASELIKASGLGALIDLVIIPWPFVLRHYVTAIWRRGQLRSA